MLALVMMLEMKIKHIHVSERSPRNEVFRDKAYTRLEDTDVSINRQEFWRRSLSSYLAYSEQVTWE